MLRYVFAMCTKARASSGDAYNRIQSVLLMDHESDAIRGDCWRGVGAGEDNSYVTTHQMTHRHPGVPMQTQQEAVTALWTGLVVMRPYHASAPPAWRMAGMVPLSHQTVMPVRHAVAALL